MTIERIEKNKATFDRGIIILFVVWVVLRLLDIFHVEGSEMLFYFARILVALAALFFVLQYLYISQTCTDERERIQKYRAHTCSWLFTMLSIMILHIACKKAILSADMALEIVLWLGFLSYILADALLERDVQLFFSDRTSGRIRLLAICLASGIFGVNIGFSIPTLKTATLQAHIGWYIAGGMGIVCLSSYILLHFVKTLREADEQASEK